MQTQTITCGHFPYFAKGLCSSCYYRAYNRKRDPETANSQKRSSYQRHREARLAWMRTRNRALDPKRSPTYLSWMSMLQRCRDPQTIGWKYYGGRGITVCDRWNPQAGGSFANFLADMGERPEGLTLDRWPDNDLGYEPQNCRWATPKEQANNRH